MGRVSRIGGAERAIEVEFDPDRLLALGLTAASVNDQLRLANIDLGGGSGDLAGQEYAIRALGAAASVEALAATPIAMPSGGTVRLDDIGTVTDGTADPETFAMSDGQPVVAFSVFRTTGASDLTAGNNAKDALAGLTAR